MYPSMMRLLVEIQGLLQSCNNLGLQLKGSNALSALRIGMIVS